MWCEQMIYLGQRFQFLNEWTLPNKEPIQVMAAENSATELASTLYEVLSDRFLGQGTQAGGKATTVPLFTHHSIPQRKYKLLLKTGSWIRLARRVQKS